MAIVEKMSTLLKELLLRPAFGFSLLMFALLCAETDGSSSGIAIIFAINAVHPVKSLVR